MTCCPHCQSADRFFDQGLAEAELRDYRTHGPTGTTRQLLDALTSAGVAGLSLLDIGGGIGVIQHELHAAGVAEITDVDASRAYLAIARREAERRGYASQARYVYGDFVALADEIDAADIVTLDRVLCCYPHMTALMRSAADRAGRFLGLVYPRDSWWVKVGKTFLNLAPRWQGEAFRSYIHPTAAVEAVAAASGLRRIVRRQGAVWQVVVFAR